MDDRYGISTFDLALLGASSGISCQFILFMKKQNSTRQHFVVWNEMMCAYLANRLGIGVPDWFIGFDNGIPTFYSRYVRGKVTTAADLVNFGADYIRKMALFNLFVLNEDIGPEGHFKHCGSTIYQFDFGAAFLGHATEQWEAHLEQWRNNCPKMERHAVCAHVTDLERFCQLARDMISKMPDHVIRYMIEEAMRMGLPRAIAEKLCDYIIQRRTTFEDYVKKCAIQFPGL